MCRIPRPGVEAARFNRIFSQVPPMGTPLALFGRLASYPCRCGGRFQAAATPPRNTDAEGRIVAAARQLKQARPSLATLFYLNRCGACDGCAAGPAATMLCETLVAGGWRRCQHTPYLARTHARGPGRAQCHGLAGVQPAQDDAGQPQLVAARQGWQARVHLGARSAGEQGCMLRRWRALLSY